MKLNCQPNQRLKAALTTCFLAASILVEGCAAPKVLKPVEQPKPQPAVKVEKDQANEATIPNWICPKLSDLPTHADFARMGEKSLTNPFVRYVLESQFRFVDCPSFFSPPATVHARTAYIPIEEFQNLLHIEGNYLRGISVFANIPVSSIYSKLKLERTSSLQILYPGGCDHIAPFEVAIKLQTSYPGIRKSKMVFTEIDENCLVGFEKVAKSLEPFIRINSKTEKTPAHGKIIDYSLSVFGMDMDIEYAVNVTTDKDEFEFFTEQQVNDSQIIIFHDTFSRNLPHEGDAIFLVSMWAAKSGRPKALIFEDFAEAAKSPDALRNYEKLPGDVTVIPGSYGCPIYGFPGAVLYFPDIEKIRSIQGNDEKENGFLNAIDHIVLQKYGKYPMTSVRPSD